MTVRPYTQQFINEPLAHIRYASEIDVDGVEVCGQPFQQPLGLAPGDENRPDFEKLNHGSCADEGSILVGELTEDDGQGTGGLRVNLALDRCALNENGGAKGHVMTDVVHRPPNPGRC